MKEASFLLPKDMISLWHDEKITSAIIFHSCLLHKTESEEKQ
jgi:hypothetical protein